MNIAFLFDLTRHSGLMMLREIVRKRQELWRRRAGNGITALIAKLSESVGIFETPSRTIPEAVESSQRRQIPQVRASLAALIAAGCGIDLTAGRLTAIPFSTRVSGGFVSANSLGIAPSGEEPLTAATELGVT